MIAVEVGRTHFNNIESFSYEWETYGTELQSRYGIEHIVVNQSQRANSFLNQSECLNTAR